MRAGQNADDISKSDEGSRAERCRRSIIYADKSDSAAAGVTPDNIAQVLLYLCGRLHLGHGFPFSDFALACKADAINAYQAAPMVGCARDLTIAAAFGGKTAEHIVEVGRMPGFAAYTALHLTARGADDEIGDFEAMFVRAFGQEQTFDRKRLGRGQRGELIETVADDWMGALRAFDYDPNVCLQGRTEATVAISCLSWPMTGTQGCMSGGNPTLFVVVTAMRMKDGPRKNSDRAAKFSGFRSIVEACNGASGLPVAFVRTAPHCALRWGLPAPRTTQAPRP